MGTTEEMEDLAEVFEVLEEIRRQLLDRLQTRDDRQDRHMVALIDALRELQMHPGDALHALVWILIAINAESTRDELVRLAAGIAEVRRREQEERSVGNVDLH